MAQTTVFVSTLWALFQRFGTMLISFVSNIILARLLTPDDFGAIGILLLFIAIANTFVDSGLGAALIQNNTITQEDKSTVFFSNLILSAILYAILFAGSPAIADFYKMPILKDLLRVQGIILFLQAFCVVQTSLLMKEMDFKKVSISNLLGTLIGAITGICLALYDFGVWSLALRTVVATLVVSVVLWSGGWKPSFCFKLKSLKKLFNFGGFVLLSSLMMTISNNIQTLILGKLFKPDVLGGYTQARSLRNIISDSLSSVIGQVLYPDFSKHQNDEEKIRQRLLLSLNIISFFTTPVLLACIMSAEIIFNFLFGEKWMAAVPYFQILCISGIFGSLQDINISLIKARGHSKSLFICNFFKTVCLCAMLVLGAKLFGVLGLLWAMVLYAFLAFIVFVMLSSHYVHISMWPQLKYVFKNIAVAGITFILASSITRLLPITTESVQVLLANTLFATLYILFAHLLGLEGLTFVIKVITKKKD